jgi:hypothetical protein
MQLLRGSLLIGLTILNIPSKIRSAGFSSKICIKTESNSRLLIPAKEVSSAFAVSVRAPVKIAFTGKNSAMSNFLSAGAKTLAKCIICGNKTSPGKKLCSEHEHLESIIAAEKQSSMERLGADHNLLESACRSCQGNITREVLCTNLYISLV